MADEQTHHAADGNGQSPALSGILYPLVRLLGVGSLGYLLGAAVMFFELPGSSMLRRGFVGGAAWYEGSLTADAPSQAGPPPAIGSVDQPEKTCDGFTLCMYGGDSQAMLIDMAGDVVHRWHVPYSQLWSDPPHVAGRVDDASIYFNDGHIYPNGDLLAVVEGPINVNNASNGYGLVKLDRNSRVLWKYAERCHHDVDVGEDGTIYALINETTDVVPPDLGDIPTPCIIDYVDVISPEGERIKRISLLAAIGNSPFAELLSTLHRPPSPLQSPGQTPAISPFRDDERRRDVLHTNALKVLTPKHAPRFPLFKAGQLLISPRHLDAIAVLDPDTEKVVWAARGPWHSQHDPSFLENGHLLIFDNLGSARSSRVLEYDPLTQEFPWSYPGEGDPRFISKIRGMCQRLPNGNTFIVCSDAGEAFEVTAEHELVWSCSSGGLEFNRARRYLSEQVPFLQRRPR
jgi:hypothetical protein